MWGGGEIAWRHEYCVWMSPSVIILVTKTFAYSFLAQKFLLHSKKNLFGKLTVIMACGCYMSFHNYSFCGYIRDIAI